MRNITVKEAAHIAGNPWVEISATRGLEDGVIIPVLNQNYTGEDLSFFVALGPGSPALATLGIVITTETNTWQHHIDCDGLRKEYVPCEFALTDNVTTTLMTLAWEADSFDNVPSPDVVADPVTVYYEIRRTDNTGPIFVVGNLIITERIS